MLYFVGSKSFGAAAETAAAEWKVDDLYELEPIVKFIGQLLAIGVAMILPHGYREALVEKSTLLLGLFLGSLLLVVVLLPELPPQATISIASSIRIAGKKGDFFYTVYLTNFLNKSDERRSRIGLKILRLI